MSAALSGDPFAPFAAELQALMPPGARPLDAHTHLGADVDGMSLDPGRLVAYLDDIGPSARACVFAFHDPDRDPAYRRPNDRVLGWARESAGRLIPYCRLDPFDDPVGEAERCLAGGARGIKLHPRAQAFDFSEPAAEAIFEVARDAGVPILIHAGSGMGEMTRLVDLALRYPEVALILAHAGIADQGLFATRLADHPRVVYDTACFSAFDVVGLFARVPAERIVFASDVPYGRPAVGLYLTLRAAAYAGLDSEDRARVVGGTMAALLDREPLPPARPPRLPLARAVDSRLLRVSHYLIAAFAAAITPPPFDARRATMWIHLARAACRTPGPGGAGHALERIDAALGGAESLIAGGRDEAFMAIGLLMSAGALAATEPGSDD